MKKLYKIIVYGACIIAMNVYVKANIYTVTSTNDAGAGSMRQAILNANANAGPDTIYFNILIVGNTFEGVIPNQYAVIQVNTSLPVITGALFIDGFTQTNTNIGSMAGRTVGVDNIVQPNIPFPDVYIVPSATYPFPPDQNTMESDGITKRGNGISIDGLNVTIRGLAVSGFGNTNTTAQATASFSADINIYESAAIRTLNVNINNCFVSCDPLGIMPVLARRITKGAGINVQGNNFTGTFYSNYVAHSGTYSIQLNGGITRPIKYYQIYDNQIIHNGTNPGAFGGRRVADGIGYFGVTRTLVTRNYIQDMEQVGIDLTHNADSSNIVNNSITGFIRNICFPPPLAGIRIAFSSRADTITRNKIYDNPGTAGNYISGIWMDATRTTASGGGVSLHDNINNILSLNQIYNNGGSGICISARVGTVAGQAYNNLISQNSIYNNTGLGIDLNKVDFTTATIVTVNDNGDGDTGPNNLQNFPMIDSVKQITSTVLAVWGKGPATSIMEFFITDGQINNHGGLTLTYGEGETFIASRVEGSAADYATGTGSYNVDGNVAVNNVNMFHYYMNVPGVLNVDSLTATATLNNNTSEFGAFANIMLALGYDISGLAASYANNKVSLNWRAVTDKHFRYFDIEHSTDGKSFSRLGSISPVDADKLIDFEYLHFNPKQSLNFYRLKMVNGDGGAKHSSIVRVNTGIVGKNLMLMNTVFNSRIDMTVQLDKDDDLAVHLFNSTGKVVRYTQVKGKAGANFIQFDGLQQLPAGNYFAVVKKTNETLNRKLIKE